MKTDLAETVNARDFGGLAMLTYAPLNATVATQDHVTGLGAAKAFCDGLFDRSILKQDGISFTAGADVLTAISTCSVSVTTGAKLLRDRRARDGVSDAATGPEPIRRLQAPRPVRLW